MLSKNEKISNFYVLQALLKIEGVPDNEKQEFRNRFDNTCKELERLGITIEKAAREKNGEYSELSFLDNLIPSFKFLIKDDNNIEHFERLLSMHYEFLIGKLLK